MDARQTRHDEPTAEDTQRSAHGDDASAGAVDDAVAEPVAVTVADRTSLPGRPGVHPARAASAAASSGRS